MFGEAFKTPRFLRPPRPQYNSWQCENCYWKVNLPMYGFRDSPRRFQTRLWKVLIAAGLKQTTYDKCAWYLLEGGLLVCFI